MKQKYKKMHTAIQMEKSLTKKLKYLILNSIKMEKLIGIKKYLYKNKEKHTK